MVSVAEAIRNYVVPNLIKESSERSSTGTTFAAHPRIDYDTIEKWTSFEDDLAAFDSMLDVPFSGELMKICPEEVVSKASVICEFRNHIKAPFLNVLKSLGHSYDIREPNGLKCIRFDPDLVLVSEDDVTPLCIFEIKSPWALPIDYQLDINACLHGNDSSYKWINAVAQLYGYMSFNHMRYGVFSNYEYSIFFSRSSDKESTLRYTAPIPAERMVGVLVRFFLFISGDSFYTSPQGTPVDTSLAKFRPRNRYKLNRIRPGQFRFSGRLADSKNGGVVLGALGKIEGSVVFKVKNICRNHGVAMSLQKEADTYKVLEKIQGSAIPLFYGLVDFNGVFHGVVTEYCGERLHDDVVESDAEIKENAFAALASLHAEGYLHGDIAERNVCVDRSTKYVRLIDLEHLKKSDNPAKFENERNRLGRFFLRNKKRRRQ